MLPFFRRASFSKIASNGTNSLEGPAINALLRVDIAFCPILRGKDAIDRTDIDWQLCPNGAWLFRLRQCLSFSSRCSLTVADRSWPLPGSPTSQLSTGQDPPANSRGQILGFRRRWQTKTANHCLCLEPNTRPLGKAPFPYGPAQRRASESTQWILQHRQHEFLFRLQIRFSPASL